MYSRRKRGGSRPSGPLLKYTSLFSQKNECAKNRASCRGGSISRLYGRSCFCPCVVEVKEKWNSRQALEAFYLEAKCSSSFFFYYDTEWDFSCRRVIFDASDRTDCTPEQIIPHK